MEEAEDKTDSEHIDISSETKAEADTESMSAAIDRLKSELESEQKKTVELSNRMKYLQADVVNLQRQNDRKMDEARSEVKLTWILELVSIKEDLRRALRVASETESPNLIDGLKLVIGRIEKTLKSESVETITAEPGTTFDPRFHEAVSYREAEEDEGKILSVIGYGCMVGGKVIKPALVEVGRRNSAKIPANSKISQIEQELKVESSSDLSE